MPSQSEDHCASQPAFAQGKRLYPRDCRVAFAFGAILCPHSHRRALRPAFPDGGEYGFTSFHMTSQCSKRAMDGLGSASTPVALRPRDSHSAGSRPATCHLAGPDSSLARCTFRRAYAVHITLALPSEPCVPPRTARGIASSSRIGFRPFRRGRPCPAGSSRRRCPLRKRR